MTIKALETSILPKPFLLASPTPVNIIQPEKISKRAIFFAALLCSVLFYELPYILTLARTGWTPLPPVVAADQMLYLNLSAIHHVSPTEVVNPWYGGLVSTLDVPHLRFPITFLLFRFTLAIFHSRTATMLVWAGIWAALTFFAAVFCLESLFPRAKPRLTLIAAIGLLVLQSPLTYLAEIRQLPSVAGLSELHLPYLRFAIPQVIVPAVLAYLGLQTRVLKCGSKWLLAGMALLQFAVCASFPYFLPVLALGTAIAILIAKLLPNREVAMSWSAILVFGTVCGLLDIGYLLLEGLGKSHGNVQLALHFRPEMILPSMRPFVFVLGTAAVLAMFSRASMATRATVAGLALANALAGFADVFFPAEAQVLDHPHYIIALTTWLPLLVFLWSFLESRDSPALRTALIGAVVAVGLWEGFASYRSSIPVNLIQKAALSELTHLNLRAKDLVVAPAQFADDLSSWIPLASPAKVLYTPDGENILSAASTRTEQASSLNSITANDGPDFRLNSLVQQSDRVYQRSPLAVDRLHARSLVRGRLGPLLASLEAGPTLARNLFARYERIILIDASHQHVLEPSTFSQWITIEKAYQRNGIQVWICHPNIPIT